MKSQTMSAEDERHAPHWAVTDTMAYVSMAVRLDMTDTGGEVPARVRQVADIVGATWSGDLEASQAFIPGIAQTTVETTEDGDEHEAQAIEKLLRVAPC